jgi:hypothetical protein
MIKNRSEKGQVMVLLILALVGLFGFAALAIDGAMIYSDRRIAQNASDSSSMAGAGAAGQEVQWITKGSWDCSGSALINAQATAVAASIASAGVNDYIIDADVSDDHGVTTVCSDSTDYYLDTVVTLTEQTDSTFAHLFFSGPLVNTVESVARVHARHPVAEGYNIISLTDDCTGNDKGTRILGDSTIILSGGGGFFSNSCFICSGSSGSITGDSIEYYDTGGFDCTGMTLNVPNIDQAADKIDPEVEAPDCDGEYPGGPVNAPGGTDIVLSPGYYKKLSVTASGDTLTMADGLYCFDGAFTFSASPLSGIGGLLNATDVTIAMVGSKGLKITGNGVMTMNPPPANCGAPGEDACPGGAIGGLLIWVDPSINDPVVLIGGSGSTFDGTVYHPSGTIEIGGNADGDTLTYGTQLIGDTIKVHGNATLDLVYNETYFYHTRSKIEVAK